MLLSLASLAIVPFGPISLKLLCCCVVVLVSITVMMMIMIIALFGSGKQTEFATSLSSPLALSLSLHDTTPRHLAIGPTVFGCVRSISLLIVYKWQQHFYA